MAGSSLGLAPNPPSNTIIVAIMLAQNIIIQPLQIGDFAVMVKVLGYATTSPHITKLTISLTFIHFITILIPFIVGIIWCLIINILTSMLLGTGELRTYYSTLV